MSLKNPVTPPGIDLGTVRLVAQRINYYATPGPNFYTGYNNFFFQNVLLPNRIISIWWFFFLWKSFCDTLFLELSYHSEHNWGKQTLLSTHLFFNILWASCIIRYVPNTQPVMWNVSEVDKGTNLPCSRAPLLKTDASGRHWR